MKKRGLGKGLNAYFENSSTENKEIVDAKDRIIYVNINEVIPNKNQPRKNFEKQALEELSNSIKELGILQPLLVVKKQEFYEIVAGERRWRAAKEAKIKKIPVIIREYDEKLGAEISLIENIQRENLNSIEEALAYETLIKEYKISQEELSVRVSKSRSSITNSLRLLKLSDNIKKLLIDNIISMGHARVALSIENEEKREEFIKKVVENSLSVREAEKLAKNFEKEKFKKIKKIDNNSIVKNYEEKLSNILNTKVIINQRDKNKGRIEIDYYSENEFTRILNLIKTIERDL